ncbi:hypothetical protein Ana3638_20405 [Anaerocolumna sedimenticola]|uniref:Uncharacterized protein n=1 Tax=Anaerocolumna sedimenticola TaxID=2696063 RepID=A0A6P1TRG6_9FIRM|nr:hypothetical protein [Anaerocolumna sedimenticola]QHQ62849.1 hypothetical protein Ana3638_20405 [Anaerocolumna sedimenticola]
MLQFFYKKKIILLAIFSLFILISIASIAYYQKPNFKLRNDGIVDNFSINSKNQTYIGKLYTQDVQYSGKVDSDIIDKYVQNLNTPDNAIAINIKFYNSNSNKLEYEANKILIN